MRKASDKQTHAKNKTRATTDICVAVIPASER